MRILLCLLLLLSLPLSAGAEIPAISAPSRIDSVTVFADRAQVTRTASVTLKAGPNLVTLDGLPQSLAEESLRVDGKGSAPARVSGISVKKVFLEHVYEKKVRDLEEEIRALNRKVESIDARRKGLLAQKAFIESIRVGWSERISKDLALGKPSTAELGDAAKFVGEGVGKIEEELNDAEAAKKPLLDKIAALKKELEQYRGNRMKEVRAVEVAVDAQRDMKFVLEVSYVVPQASWEPTYDVRLAPDGKDAELVYRAQVWQRTGEDWPGVKLALSTASPEVGGAPPELIPWHVSLFEPPRPMPYRARDMAPMAPAPMMKAEESAVGGVAQEAQMERALPVPAQLAEGQTSVIFNVRQPVDVPSDGTRAGTTISVEKVPVVAEYVTVPKLVQRVYLKSEVTNATPYPLLPGEINIFNDVVYTGKSQLKLTPSGDKFDLYFGSDDQIKVKREVARVAKKAGMLGSNSVSYRITVQLENLKKKSVKVSLLDQLPLPGNAEIKVNLEDAAPKPEETRQDGTLVWKVNLAPGEKKTVAYEMVIEYPKGREIVGAE